MATKALSTNLKCYQAIRVAEKELEFVKTSQSVIF